MRGLARSVGVVMVVLAAALAALDADTPGQSFQTLQAGFTQSLYGVSDAGKFKIKSAVLGGVAVLPSGDVLVEECLAGAAPQLHRFSATATKNTHSTTLHVETIIPLALPSGSWCGMVYHPDGTLYLNGSDAGGLANITIAGALIRRLGTAGNGVGIAVDPVTNHIVYTGSTCVATSTAGCKLLDVDPATATTTTRVAYAVTDAQFVNGINFDPAGSFIFLDNRTPANRLTIATRDGAIVQHVAMPAATQPVGIAFSAASPAFVLTNNTDATISRFDFPNDDFTLAPVRTTLASGGYRGDQMQVGGDGCAYVTQAGSTYDNGDQGRSENSVVRICGGLAPPPGVPPQTPTGILTGTVTDAVSALPIAGATVALANNASFTTDAAGHYTATVFPGSYDTTASAADYTSVTALDIAVFNGLTTTRDYALMPKPGTLTGVVTNTAGAPIANAKVLLSNGKSDTTDGAGHYQITAIVPGDYSATVTQPSYDTLAVPTVTVPINATAVYNFTLTQTPGTLKGLVTDKASLPLAGATVALSNGLSAVSDASGAYAIGGILPATLTATVTLTNYDTLTVAGIVIPNAGTVTKNFVLQQTPGALQGVVSDPAGAPIAGATIRLSTGATATANASGAYSFASVNPGTYSATVSAATFAALTTAADITIASAATTTRNFTLTPLPGAIQGIVTNGAGAPVAGATVTLLPGGAVVVTPANGTFSFTQLTPGTYSLSVTATSYSPATAAGIVVTNGATTTRNVTLTPVPGILQGTVTDAAGTPIVGATVALSSGISATTIAGGIYAFTAVAPGTYTATASADTYSTTTVSGITIAPGGTTTQDFSLKPLPGTIQGAITDISGRAVGGATVTLAPAGATIVTGGDGVYAFTGLTPGAYSVSVAASGYTGATATVAVGNGATVTRDFVLSPIPGILQGTVTSAAGAPIPSATVTLSTGATVLSDAAGKYTFTQLMPGTYDATAAALNYNPASVNGIVITRATATTVNFTLTQTTGKLQGTVTNAAQQPLAGATVLLSNGVATTTDAGGGYLIASLAPGTYTATVSLTNYNGASASIVIPNGGTVVRNFVLTQTPGTIQGVVTAVGGGPIASATVALDNGASATTNGAGAYAITGLVPGTYTATVAAVNYVAISATNIAVANGGTTTRNFALSPMFGALQGTVSSSAGSSLIPGATVALSNGGGSTTTDAAGHYAFSTLAPGTYTATVTAPPAGDPCKAANAFFGLGAASSYTLLGIDVAGCSGTQFNMGAGTAAIDGDIGIGSSVDGTITGGEFRGKLVVDPSGSYTVAKTGPVIHGGVSRQDLKAAVSAATAAAARLAKLTPTQKLPAITTSIAITGNGGINVVSIPSLKIVGGTITIRGTASEIFVFNVAGKFELDNSDVVLADGVRACNILWNFTGTAITESNEVELENGASAAGIFLAMSRLVELESSSLDGQVLAGGDIEVWGATITKPAGAATIAYDVLTVPGIVIPAGTTVTRNFALVPTDACRGANSFFGLGPANSYALLGIGVAGCSGTTIDMGASSTIGGDVGIGDSVDASLEGGTIEGRLVTDPSASYWIPRRGGTSIQGGVSKASLDDAVATATAAANRLAKLTATQKLSAATKSITITGNGGVNVVSIPSVKIVNGALTIHGSPSDIFVVNVAGKFELDSSDVVLDGGVRACNVLWNFTGSAITESNEVELENGSTAAGVFLALSRLVDLEDSTLNGRVLAGGDLEVWTSTIRPPQ